MCVCRCARACACTCARAGMRPCTWNDSLLELPFKKEERKNFRTLQRLCFERLLEPFHLLLLSFVFADADWTREMENAGRRRREGRVWGGDLSAHSSPTDEIKRKTLRQETRLKSYFLKKNCFTKERKFKLFLSFFFGSKLPKRKTNVKKNQYFTRLHLCIGWWRSQQTVERLGAREWWLQSHPSLQWYKCRLRRESIAGRTTSQGTRK